MTRVKKNSIQKEKIIFVGLFAIFLGMIFSYMYLLSATVLHVVMRTEVNQEIRTIRSDISELEGDFIAAQHRVSSKIASMQGYEETGSKIFIDRTPASLVLSSGGER